MLAMHVAATNPVALALDQVPADVLARESAILEEKNAGKPANVLEKIVASGLKTFAKENCLLEQAYVHDGAKTVTQALAEAGNYATWRDGLRSQIITNWQAMSEGARLPACGTQKNCDWCDARGLCRKGAW